MEEWDWRKRLGYGALQAIGFGFVGGAAELVVIAADLQLRLIAVEVLLLGAIAVVVNGGIAGTVGLLAGLVVHPLSREVETSRAVARQLALTGALLGLLYLGTAAAALFAQDQPIGALAMLAMPVGFAGVIFYNARYWLRRTELERAPVAWLPIAGGLAVALVAGGATLYAMRETRGAYYADEPKSVVFVTIEGMRHDDRVPALAAIGTEGIRFLDAVSPSPHATPAAATVMTGLHPLRHGVLVERDELPRGYRTLAEILGEARYVTAAFVSTRTVDSSTGLAQGFDVYDDDWAPIPGVGKIFVVGRILRWWVPRSDPDGTGPWSRRPSMATVERFLPWLEQYKAERFFTWVHLSGNPTEIDEALTRLRAGLQHHGVLESSLLVVSATHGEMRGEHGTTGSVGLYDPAIRVPLVVRAPGVKMETPLVDAQVRLMDLAATALEWCEVDEPGDSEGVSLLDYGTGKRRATMWVSLVGRGPDGAIQVGMRNNGLKYVREADGTERLFDLGTDPAEQTNLALEQQETLTQARLLLSSEITALERILERRGL